MILIFTLYVHISCVIVTRIAEPHTDPFVQTGMIAITEHPGATATLFGSRAPPCAV